MIEGTIYRHKYSVDIDIYVLSVSDDLYEVMYLNRPSKRLQVETSDWVKIDCFELWDEVSADEYPESLVKYLHGLRSVF